MSASNQQDYRHENRRQSSRRNQSFRNGGYGNDGYRDDRGYYPDQRAHAQIPDRYDEFNEGVDEYDRGRHQQEFSRDRFEGSYQSRGFDEQSQDYGHVERQDRYRSGNQPLGGGYRQGQHQSNSQRDSGRYVDQPWRNPESDWQDPGRQYTGSQGYGSQQRGGQQTGRQEFGDYSYERGRTGSGWGERSRGYDRSFDQKDYSAGSYESSRQYRRNPGTSHAGRGPKGYKRTDDRITEEINQRLTDHDDIDASEIEVKVKDGDVTLTGTVCDRGCRRHVEDVVEMVSGVQDVSNQLKIRKNCDSSGNAEKSGAKSTAAASGSTSKTGGNA